MTDDDIITRMTISIANDEMAKCKPFLKFPIEWAVVGVATLEIAGVAQEEKNFRH